jgi:hypothetical protein
MVHLICGGVEVETKGLSPASHLNPQQAAQYQTYNPPSLTIGYKNQSLATLQKNRNFLPGEE